MNLARAFREIAKAAVCVACCPYIGQAHRRAWGGGFSEALAFDRLQESNPYYRGAPGSRGYYRAWNKGWDAGELYRWGWVATADGCMVPA